MKRLLYFVTSVFTTFNLAFSQEGWVDFRNPDTYAIRGGGIWELKTFKDDQNNKFLYAANIGGPLQKCTIPSSGSADPSWSSFLPYSAGCSIDVYGNVHGSLIGYGTPAFHVNSDSEGFFFSTDNCTSFGVRNPVGNEWQGGVAPPRWFVQDVAILRDPDTNPVTDLNYWILIYGVPLGQFGSEGIYHYYKDSSGTFDYHYESFNSDTSSAWKTFADLDPANPDGVVAYACGSADVLNGFGAWRCVLEGNSYIWRSLPGSYHKDIVDVYQDENTPDYLFFSEKLLDDDSGVLFFASHRGAADWTRITSFDDNEVGNRPNGYARDLVADWVSDDSVRVWAALGAVRNTAQGPYQLDGHPDHGVWTRVVTGLMNANPNREMLINDPDDFNRIYWGSWGAGVFEYELANGNPPWNLWDQRYSAEFNRSLRVDHRSMNGSGLVDVLYVANQGGGIWQGTSNNLTHNFTEQGNWTIGGTIDELWQRLEISPFDTSNIYATCWDTETPLYRLSKSNLASLPDPVDIPPSVTGYNYLQITALAADFDHHSLYLGVNCSNLIGLNGSNEIKLLRLDGNGSFVELVNPAKFDSIPINDIGLGDDSKGNRDLWVATGTFLWSSSSRHPNLWHYNSLGSGWSAIYSAPPDTFFDQLLAVEVLPAPSGDKVFYSSYNASAGDQIAQGGSLYFYSDSSDHQTTNLSNSANFSGPLIPFRTAGYASLVLMPYNTQWMLFSVGGIINESSTPERLLVFSPWEGFSSRPPNQWQGRSSPQFDAKTYPINDQWIDYEATYHHIFTTGGKVMEYNPDLTTQTLPSNWSWISLRVHPWNNSVAAVTGGLGASLIAVQNNIGQFYYPNGVNNLGIWEDFKGYKIKTTDNASLEAWGDSIDIFTEITLIPSQTDTLWFHNLIAYLPEDTLNVNTVFQSYTDTVLIVKNDAGNFWRIGDNESFDLIPGSGYEVAVQHPIHFHYPANVNFTPMSPRPEQPSESLGDTPTHYQFSSRTGEFYPIYVNNVTINDSPLAIGDEIGCFTPSGLCVGGNAYSGILPLKIAAWKDDPTTSVIDGYTPGNLMTFKLFVASAGTEVLLQAVTSSLNDDQPTLSNTHFEQGYYASLTLAGSYTLPSSYRLMQNFPNPFNPATTIRYDLPFMSHVTLEIFDLMGRKVVDLVDGDQLAGYQAAHWNGKNGEGVDIASGVYFTRLTVQSTQEHLGKIDHFEKTLKMVLVR